MEAATEIPASESVASERAGFRACVIGAGSSGIASCQVLDARGIPFDCFEVGSGVGGNWRYENDNGMSSAYRSLHINTSRRTMAYATFPMPEDYPDYPNHFQIARYFDDYVDHFGFRDRIRFRTEVTGVEPADGRWRVAWRELDGGETGADLYDAVLVANGHHWHARWPEPPYPRTGGVRERADARPQLPRARQPRGQAGTRAGHRKLGDRHRR